MLPEYLDSEVFGRIYRQDEGWTGKISLLPNKITPFEIYYDICDPTDEEIMEYVKKAENLRRHLDAGMEVKLRLEAAKEIVEAVFQQSPEEVDPAEIKKLNEDMELKSVDFCGTMAVFRWVSNEFPGQTISLQITENLKVDDIAID